MQKTPRLPLGYGPSQRKSSGRSKDEASLSYALQPGFRDCRMAWSDRERGLFASFWHGTYGTPSSSLLPGCCRRIALRPCGGTAAHRTIAAVAGHQGTGRTPGCAAVHPQLAQHAPVACGAGLQRALHASSPVCSRPAKGPRQLPPAMTATCALLLARHWRTSQPSSRSAPNHATRAWEARSERQRPRP